MIDAVTGDGFPESCMVAGSMEPCDAPSVAKPSPVDKARMWDALKGELESEARGANTGGNAPGITAFSDTPESILARSMLDRMIQLETLAMVREVRL